MTLRKVARRVRWWRRWPWVKRFDTSESLINWLRDNGEIDEVSE